MITCDLKGGLGNMMFQIASIYSLALDNKSKCVFKHQKSLNQGNCSSTYVNNIFRNIDFSLNSLSYFQYRYYEDDFTYMPLPYRDNTIYDGYFQSHLYFQHNREKIKELFCVEKHEVDNSKIAVHIRRGDYIDYHDTHVNLLEKTDYYKNAFDYFGKNSEYIIFSDDIEWCKKNITLSNVQYSESGIDHEDMCKMSQYTKKIIANSSFSWWSAWLTNDCEKIIAPKQWFGKKGVSNWHTIYNDTWEVL